MPIRTAALLLPLLAVPALAQADAATTSADLVAAVVIGFAGDGTAMVNGNETANVTRDGPGRFSGTIEEDGSSFSFAVTEVAPCVFEAAYAQGDDVFRVGFDLNKVSGMRFEEAEPQAGYTFFDFTLDGEAGAVETIAPDGRRAAAGNRNRIGTSLTLAELEAAVAALLARCPAP